MKYNYFLILMLFVFLNSSCQKDKPQINGHGPDPLFNLKIDFRFDDMSDKELAYIRQIRPRITAVFYDYDSSYYYEDVIRLKNNRDVQVKHKMSSCSKHLVFGKEQSGKIFEANCDLVETKTGFTCMEYSEDWLQPKLKRNVPYALCLYFHHAYQEKTEGYGDHSSEIRLIMKDDGYYFQQGPFVYDEPETDLQNFFNIRKVAYVRHNSFDDKLAYFQMFELPYEFQKLIIYPFVESKYMKQLKNYSTDEL